MNVTLLPGYRARRLRKDDHNNHRNNTSSKRSDLVSLTFPRILPIDAIATAIGIGIVHLISLRFLVFSYNLEPETSHPASSSSS